MSGWIPKYNCHRIAIGSFYATVHWSTTRGRQYEVAFENARLKRDFRDLDTAKGAALQLARRVLTRSLDALDGIQPKAGIKSQRTVGPTAATADPTKPE